jgi:hypothetical protein
MLDEISNDSAAIVNGEIVRKNEHDSFLTHLGWSLFQIAQFREIRRFVSEPFDRESERLWPNTVKQRRRPANALIKAEQRFRRGEGSWLAVADCKQRLEAVIAKAEYLYTVGK